MNERRLKPKFHYSVAAQKNQQFSSGIFSDTSLGLSHPKTNTLKIAKQREIAIILNKTCVNSEA
jgi:hypothetical protein